MTGKIDWPGFGKAIMEAWPERGIDGGDLQTIAQTFNVIQPVKGGFDPKRHSDEYGFSPYPGDEWFRRNYRSK